MSNVTYLRIELSIDSKLLGEAESDDELAKTIASLLGEDAKKRAEHSVMLRCEGKS